MKLPHLKTLLPTVTLDTSSCFPYISLLLLVGLISATALAGCSRLNGDNISVDAATASPQVVNSITESLEQFKGKVVLLDLWTTWCPPCRVEIPSLIKLQQKYRDKGLMVIGVALDPIDPRGGGGAAAVAPFVHKAGINYTVWMIENEKALKGYPMGLGYPTTYLIGRDGLILRQYVGAQPEETFEKEITLALGNE